MNKYDIIRDVLSVQLAHGEIAEEYAELVAEDACEKYDEEIDVLTESMKATIGKIVRSTPDKIDMLKKWGVKQNDPHVYEKDNVSDKDYEKIVSLFKKMMNDNIYSIYKKHFDELSRTVGIHPSVIISYVWKKGEKDKNYIKIRYEEKNKRVTIPNGYKLYHISPANNIKELIPKFKGKPPRCYFYSTPRTYVSIKKDMAHGYAQFKGKQANVKTTKYELCENITSAFLDDRIGNVLSGAVYIETKFPIKVKKIEE